MVEQEVAVRRIGPGERPALVDVLVAAFEGDPWYRWRYPGHDYPARAREWFDLVTERVWPRAEAYLAADGDAGAIWIRPGRELAEPDDLVALLRLVERQHGERAPEVVDAILAVAGLEPEGVHALCLFVGVRPERQGRGLGQAIMRPVLDRLDRDGTPAFLVATVERAVAFYARLGFRPVGEVEPLPGLVFRPMLREPGR